MKSVKDFSLFQMSKEEYLNLFPPMNAEVRTQDDGNTAIIDIDGYIGRDVIREWLTGEKSPNTIDSLKEKLRDISASKIITNINSYGGDLNAGIVIKDMLQSKRARVITNMMGFSASAATVIAQAGTVRRMSETSFMLVHRSMIGMLGYYNLNTFEALIDDQQVIDNALITMYAKRAEIAEDEIADLMDEGEGYGRWVDAEEAMEKGFIDEIYDPADEEDPNTDHLEPDEDEEENAFTRENLKQALAFHSLSNIDDILDRNTPEPKGTEGESVDDNETEEQETAAAEEARSKRKIETEMFIKSNEV